MAHLAVFLFGGFGILLDGSPVSGLRSDKVRALWAYLAVEAERPHSREALAGLLWPDSPDANALNSLRNALANLRHVVGDAQAGLPLFRVTREAIHCDPNADLWLDVTEFERQMAQGQQLLQAQNGETRISALEAAISLYRGPLLAGFSVSSAPFEEWALYKREQFQRMAVAALRILAGHYEAADEHAAAQDFIRRQLALEPYAESAHRQLMRVLALSGQRGAALAQYDACRRVLAAELGVKPARATTALYEAIRDGVFDPGARRSRSEAISPPVALSPLHAVIPSSFVAREPELAKLNQHLATALSGAGHVVFITGDAGSGKTALAGAFAAQAMATHGNLLVATGVCSAHASIGDPYLPFVEVLQLLTGDIEAKRAGGAISPEHARRLWEAVPHTLRILSESGPDLIGRFVPAAPLVLHNGDGRQPQSPWQRRLAVLVERAGAAGPDRQLAPQSQMRLFDQVTRVLTSLARRVPLILILDDLQWADAGSTTLLFHLGRRLAGSRILLIGAYRPGDLAAKESVAAEPQEGGVVADARPSLISVVNELRRTYGDILVDLSQTDLRRFLNAYLDREPNRLGAAFREALYRHTEGHALFTVELVRGFRERGDLVRDVTGHWIEGPSLSWEHVPAPVEAVIAEGIGRLSPRYRTLLAAASVEGEEFTAEVLARVLGLDEQLLIEQLSGPLCKREHLVGAHSLRRLDATGQRLSVYRFQHSLYQKYLYQSLDEVERVRLHQAIGETLEALYGAGSAEVESSSLQLARHFAEAGMVDKAVNYLLQAGGRAVLLAANAEAIAMFRRGLALLQTASPSPQRARQEMQLQYALGTPIIATRGWGPAERATALARAGQLSQEVGDVAGILQVMLLQADLHRARGECELSAALGEQALGLAQQTKDPLNLALAHYTCGADQIFTTSLISARAHLEQAIALWDPQRAYSVTRLVGVDVGVMSRVWLTWALSGLGYPEQALRCSQEALLRAQALAQPFTIGLVMILTSLRLAADRGDERTVRELTAALAQSKAAYDVTFFETWIIFYRGWLKSREGPAAAGTAEMRKAIDAWEAIGSKTGAPYQLVVLAEAYRQQAQIAQGLAAVAEGLALIEETGTRYFEADFHRLRGELLQQAGARQGTAYPDENPGQCFGRAISVARRQDAKLSELRATLRLCRLWGRQGRAAEAIQTLRSIYDWFTEGFDLPDLTEARALLDELNSAPHQAAGEERGA
jgi:DNA-binding SARP family transcriptional activator/predicted ATPase